MQGNIEDVRHNSLTKRSSRQSKNHKQLQLKLSYRKDNNLLLKCL